MDPKTIQINDFDYILPESRIAVYPKEIRDTSKLLIYDRHHLSGDIFSNIVSYLPASSLIIFNDSRVVEARILFQKATGATIEIFCLEPASESLNIANAFSTHQSVTWKCLIGNSSGWPHGTTIEKKFSAGFVLLAKIISREKDYFIVQLSWTPEHLSFAEVLHNAGIVPLPPYIKRKPETSDTERYQTIYANGPGSVAAPTAGFHFTSTIINQLASKNILRNFVTLHVGAGTFKPVKSETLEQHEMHAEVIEVNKDLIDNLIHYTDQPVIAVGTTSVRTLESLYWIGVKINHNKHISAEALHISQWEPYDHPSSISARTALSAIKEWMNVNGTDILITKTSLLIVPSYEFRIVSVMITNFHQPRSTLLLLVAAFIGEEWKKAYTYALENDFRFLSYGDSCLFFRQ
jgi:S-adenosylmethionine:tRNA ribosyltransferase-isomerase